MIISLDGGALCSPQEHRFGTYQFSRNFVEALTKYEPANTYEVYTFCARPLHTFDHYKKLTFKTLRPTWGWMDVRVSIQEHLQKKDIFFALNQAMPRSTPSRIFAWSHGAAYLHRPDLYPRSQSKLKGQLLKMGRRAEVIFVPSARVKKDIAEFVQGTPIHIVPIGVPFDMPLSLPLAREPFFLFVGMNHPIKNIPFLINAFAQVVANKKYSHYKLVLVTNNDYGLDLRHPNIKIVQCTRKELRQLYRTASGLLSASLYESFNIPILEALSQRCPVVAMEDAVIPELEPYVAVTRSQEEFVERMKLVAELQHRARQKPEGVHTEFSWRPIIKTVKSFY